MRVPDIHAESPRGGGAAPAGDPKVNGFMIVLPDDLQPFDLDEPRMYEFAAEAAASLPLGEEFDATSLAMLFDAAWSRGVIVHDPSLVVQVSSVSDADGFDQFWRLTVASAAAVGLPALTHIGLSDIEEVVTSTMPVSQQVRAGLTEVVEMANSILLKVQEETPNWTPSRRL